MHKFESIRKAVAGISVCAVMAGCSQPPDTMEMSSATGAVLGAGLGAIVGTQTGDPGTGLLLGAAAGAGTGALIGDKIQTQDEAIRSQDLALERQDRIMQGNRTQIEELRRTGQDPVAYSRRPATGQTGKQIVDARARYSASPARPTGAYPSAAGQAIRESTLVAPQVTARRLDALNQPPAAGFRPHSSGGVVSTNNSPECQQAEGEARSARNAADTSNKLFHLRRALRLCPESATLHTSLGEVYASIGRDVDAKFEFEEANRLAAGHERAQADLPGLR